MVQTKKSVRKSKRNASPDDVNKDLQTDIDYTAEFNLEQVQAEMTKYK